MDHSSNEMYTVQTEPLQHISNITTLLQRLRVGVREYALGVFNNDTNQIESARTTNIEIQAELDENFEEYDTTIIDTEARKLFDESLDIYKNKYLPSMDRAYSSAKAGDVEEVNYELAYAKDFVTTIVDNFDRCMEINVEAAERANEEITKQSNLLLILIVSVAFTIFLSCL